MSSEPDRRFQVYTYVVLMRGSDGRATLPVTICALPEEAEDAARLVAYLELTVLGQTGDAGSEFL